MPYPSRAPAVLCRGPEKSPLERHGRSTAEVRHGQGIVCVNQTRPYCVNQMGKPHLNPWRHGMAGERHGQGMLCATHQSFRLMGTGSKLRGRSVELSYVYLVLRLRMHVALPPALTFMTAWSQQLCHSFSSYTNSLLFIAGLDSSVATATTLRAGRSQDRIPMGTRFSVPAHRYGPPSLLYDRYRVIPGGKAAVAWR